MVSVLDEFVNGKVVGKKDSAGSEHSAVPEGAGSDEQLCCGAPDAETGVRLRTRARVARRPSARVVRLADVRRVM
ncbi:MAG: hypothetical protein N2595_02630 [bacterium]|nr:hypothetical protein [bacterium]